MDQQVLFQNGTVEVSSKIFSVGSTQFPIRNIGSIHIRKVAPDRKGPLWILAGGFFLSMFGAKNVLFALVGIGVIGGAMWLLIKQKPTHWIEVVSSGKTSRAYGSSELGEIQQIQSAINIALANV